MKVELFDFALPSDRIATRPTQPRDSARLLEIAASGLHEHTVRDLPALLRAGDILVFNDTKVIPARLMGSCGAAKVEITLHKQLAATAWQVFAKPAKRLRPGNKFIVATDFTADVIAKDDAGLVTLHFTCPQAEFFPLLERYGHMPLPPYMKRDDDTNDWQDYQTIYAKHEGAVAAPTAGLHFTDGLFQALDAKGIKRAFVTLHVGAGTFLPVKVEDTKDHVMHMEVASISVETAQAINEAKRQGGRVIAVGTTSLRVLESAASEKGELQSFNDETGIFITPGYRFKITDMLMTNFHLPKSTLFMLVCAFAGMDTMKKAYQHAIERNYRFYSYGDACLLHRHDDTYEI